MIQRSEMPERQSTTGRRTAVARQARIGGRTPLLALGVIVLVFLVALGSSRSLHHVSGPGDLEHARLVAGDLIVLLVGVAVIPAMLLVIWQMVRELREEGPGDVDDHRERKVMKQVLVIALVGGAIALLALARPQKQSVESPTSNSHRPIAAHLRDKPDRTAETLLPWVVGGVGACCVFLVATAFIRRRRGGIAIQELIEDGLEAPRRELHRQVEISIAEIERESDPRRAVIHAYAGMEKTLARHKLGRRSFEAPGEYLHRAFAALRLSRRPGERLTELFEQARFSTHTIGLEMKRESIAALIELRSELEAKPQ